ncbi:MAG: response regulator [Magnetococcales bacterium]|nr:response regulator [Magnetococcales bacterium]
MLRIDHLVKESFPRAEVGEALEPLSTVDRSAEFVVFFKAGQFAGITSLRDGSVGGVPLKKPRIQQGATISQALELMALYQCPALPVFDQDNQFVGIVTNESLSQVKSDLAHGTAELVAENRQLSKQIAKLNASLIERSLQEFDAKRSNQALLTISALLRTSLEPLSLNEQLSVALDLILSIPWLSIRSQGSIFLADGTGYLDMVAQQGLADCLLSVCKRIPLGHCLCGQAALSRIPVFSNGVDHRHTVRYDGMQPHGHYCFPILSNNDLLGVINLYLVEDHVRDTDEEAFLLSVANTLAGLIRRKQMEEALKRAKEEAESASLAKTSFLANVSHEIRTPLNAIVGFSRILLKHRSQIPAQFLNYLENIRVSGISLTEIINNVLDLAKIEAGKVETDEEDVDIRLLLQSLYQISKDRAAEKGVMVFYDIDPNLPKKIRTDRTRLNQILMNLVANAIKFTEKGKEIKIVAQRNQQALILRVLDQGIGIPAQRLHAIFRPFEQADSSITRSHGGTGLGLTIVQSQVEILRGSVHVTSEEGVGSEFVVRLPMQAVEEEIEAIRSKQWRNHHFPTNLKILLVEDNTMNQEMLLAVLAVVGLTAKIADNGRQGVEMALAWKPDLILMDLHMPIMDGLTATRRIRQSTIGSSLPIIGISADAFVERQEQAVDAGFSHFLTKPVDLDQLMSLMVRCLGLTAEEGGDQGVACLPVSEGLIGQLRAILQDIERLPPFESGRIVSLCETGSQLCAPFDLPYQALFDQIREAVFARNSKIIPDLVQRALNL